MNREFLLLIFIYIMQLYPTEMNELQVACRDGDLQRVEQLWKFNIDDDMAFFALRAAAQYVKINSGPFLQAQMYTT